MKTVLIVSLIFALAFVFTRPIFSTRWQFFGFRLFFLSGVELLLVGYALGPRGLDVFPEPVLESMEPLLHLGVGWAGLLFGLQFNRRSVGMYRLRRYALAFWQATLTAALCAAVGWLLIHHLVPAADLTTLQRSAVLIAACAAGTAPSSIHYFSRVFQIRGRVNRLLKFIVAVDGIPAVVILGIFTSLFHVSEQQ